MTPTRRALTFGSYWIIGVVAFAVLLAPYELTWRAHADIPAVLTTAPGAGSDSLGWVVYALVTIAIPLIGGTIGGRVVAAPFSDAPTSVRTQLAAYAGGAIVSICAGWVTLIASALTFSAIPPRTTLADATYAFIVWTAYAAVALAVARSAARRNARLAMA
ncbi:hypothetical protein [Nocardioides sp. NPDC127503]|uniref:hypothetical protein n=1 Tax=Nocardioides sp. NPDC127503 TaxID=3154516 RepID=UPI00331E18B3